MPETEPRKPHRRWRLVLAVVVILVVVGAIALRHYTRTDRLTALIIEQARSALGADLAIGGTAHYDLWPILHLVLPTPSLKAADSSAFFKADAIEVRVPWRILWADRYDIEQIDVIRPTLDLDALTAWLATRPASTTPVPDIRLNLHLIDGTATSVGKVIAEGVNLTFANGGDLSAWLPDLRSGKAGSTLLPPMSGSADARAIQIGTTRIEGVRMEVRNDSTRPREPAARP